MVAMVVAETLPSGLRLVTESMPHVRSVTVGVWLTRGSRHESDAESGIAHFVEHMLFKGTTTPIGAGRSRRTIDSIGGQLDAFTAKEYAGYYIKVLDEHLPLALDLLSDMVLRPAFAAGRHRARAGRHPRRDQDGRGRARRSGARGVRAAVLAAASARPADSRHAGDRLVVRRRRPSPVFRAHLRRAEPAHRGGGHLDHAELRDLVERAFADLPVGRRLRDVAPPEVTPGAGGPAARTSSRATSASARRRISRRTPIGTRCTC